MAYVQIISGNEHGATRKYEMKPYQLYEKNRLIKNNAENAVSQHLYKFNHNIGEVNVEYQWKVLCWNISIMITLLEK